ncbi:MAG: DUF2625 family protein [Kofleriaceae bacterium]
MKSKTARELVSDDPAMPMIRAWLDGNARPIEILPCQPDHGEVSLVALQVTTRSPLGAIAHETGGIFIDDGWLRVLGAGSAKLARTIAGWNGLPCDPGDAFLPGAMFVADDVIGGMFAIDVGALGAKQGNIAYFAPDTLAWEDTGLGYTEWLYWAFTGDLETFYEGSRWHGWRGEVPSLVGTHAYSIQPFPWLQGPALAERDRRAVPIRELRDLQLKMAVEIPRSNA